MIDMAAAYAQLDTSKKSMALARQSKAGKRMSPDEFRAAFAAGQFDTSGKRLPKEVRDKLAAVSDLAALREAIFDVRDQAILGRHAESSAKAATPTALAAYLMRDPVRYRIVEEESDKAADHASNEQAMERLGGWLPGQLYVQQARVRLAMSPEEVTVTDSQLLNSNAGAALIRWMECRHPEKLFGRFKNREMVGEPELVRIFYSIPYQHLTPKLQTIANAMKYWLLGLHHETGEELSPAIVIARRQAKKAASLDTSAEATQSSALAN